MPNADRVLVVPGDWRRPGAGEVYTIVWRGGGDYGELLPRPPEHAIPQFYAVDDYYTHQSGPAPDAGPVREPLHWRALRHLLWRLDWGAHPDAGYFLSKLPDRDGRFLDIGCGGGLLVAEIARHGADALGVEPDPAARDVATAAGARVLPGTAERLPAEIADGSVDLVNLSHVLEHCLQPEAALRAALAKLRPGGVLVVEVPNNACAGARMHGSCWYWLDAPRHLNFFTPESLVRMVRAAGAEVQSVEFCGYSRQVLRGWLDMQKRIRRAFAEMGARDLPNRNGFWNALRFLMATAFAPPERKYDSVRVVAVKPAHARQKPTVAIT